LIDKSVKYYNICMTHCISCQVNGWHCYGCSASWLFTTESTSCLLLFRLTRSINCTFTGYCYLRP